MNTYINNSVTLHILKRCPLVPDYSNPQFIDPQRLLYLLHLGQLSPCVLIVPQVLLVPHQDDGDIGTEVLHLRRPLLWDIFCPGRDKK